MLTPIFQPTQAMVNELKMRRAIAQNQDAKAELISVVHVAGLIWQQQVNQTRPKCDVTSNLFAFSSVAAVQAPQESTNGI